MKNWNVDIENQITEEWKNSKQFQFDKETKKKSLFNRYSSSLCKHSNSYGARSYLFIHGFFRKI